MLFEHSCRLNTAVLLHDYLGLKLMVIKYNRSPIAGMLVSGLMNVK